VKKRPKNSKKGQNDLKKAKTYCEKKKTKTLVFGSVAQLIRPALPILWGLGLPIFEACACSTHFWGVAWCFGPAMPM